MIDEPMRTRLARRLWLQDAAPHGFRLEEWPQVERQDHYFQRVDALLEELRVLDQGMSDAGYDAMRDVGGRGFHEDGAHTVHRAIVNAAMKRPRVSLQQEAVMFKTLSEIIAAMPEDERREVEARYVEILADDVVTVPRWALEIIISSARPADSRQTATNGASSDMVRAMAAIEDTLTR
jgi:hypothetical protein